MSKVYIVTANGDVTRVFAERDAAEDCLDQYIDQQAKYPKVKFEMISHEVLYGQVRI